ncbi:MAG: hypothetical protein H8D23_21030 [Candidatus Brocadiales bacterium]|nr:hypothetical protein [Candidatus Brocadiales bacterium]
MASVGLKYWSQPEANNIAWNTGGALPNVIDRLWTQHKYTWDIISLQPITADGASAVFEVPQRWDYLLIYMNITAVSGTLPTWDMTYQVSPDYGGTWYDHTSFGQATTTGTDMLKIDSPGKYWRMNYNIGGSATPTFTVSIEVEGRRIGGGY